MIPFGDADLEDAWDASDPVPYLLDNIALRVLWLLDLINADNPDRPGHITRLFEDIETIRARTAAGEL